MAGGVALGGDAGLLSFFRAASRPSVPAPSESRGRTAQIFELRLRPVEEALKASELKASRARLAGFDKVHSQMRGRTSGGEVCQKPGAGGES